MKTSLLIKLNKEIFQAASRCYTWQHVLTAADFRGETERMRQDLADALAIREYADEQGFEVTQAEVESAQDEFRFRHNLISGEETEQWLDHCGLSLDDFKEFFRRRLLMNRFHAQVTDICRNYAPSDTEVADYTWPEAILTGDYERLTVPLARRVAVRLDGSTRCTPGELTEVRHIPEARLRGHPFDPEWFAELVEMEARYASAEREALTPDRCAREIRTRFLQLTRIEIAQVTFPSLDQAREAYACITGEGERLDAVAARSRRIFDLAARFYDEVPEDVRSLFFSATPGRVVPPMDKEGLFAVYEIRRRIEPDLNDAEVLARVRKRLLSVQFDALVSRHVRWLFDPWSPA
jgi:hypothetical protein